MLKSVSYVYKSVNELIREMKEEFNVSGGYNSMFEESGNGVSGNKNGQMN